MVLGTGSTEPIVAESRWIKVLSPRPNDEVRDVLALRGICNVFEGTVNFRLRKGQSVLYEGFATGAMGDWGYFQAEIPVNQYARGPVVLEVFTYSAKDGSVQDLIVIPLKLVK